MTIIIAQIQRSTTDFTTTSTTLVNADTITQTYPNTTTYVVHYSYELTSSSTSGIVTSSLLVDDVEMGTSCFKPPLANAYLTISHELPLINLASGNHTLLLKIKSNSTSYTAKVRRIYIIIRAL
jgi:hypothetical protein